MISMPEKLFTQKDDESKNKNKFFPKNVAFK
jgi:hypothetical protein